MWMVPRETNRFAAYPNPTKQRLTQNTFSITQDPSKANLRVAIIDFLRIVMFQIHMITTEY